MPPNILFPQTTLSSPSRTIVDILPFKFSLGTAITEVSLIIHFHSIQGHRELLTDEVMAPVLEGVEVLTDEQRINQVRIL